MPITEVGQHGAIIIIIKDVNMSGIVEGVIAVAGVVVNIFKGSGKKRAQRRAQVVAFWDPILGQNNWPPEFINWIWGGKKGYRGARNGINKTNAFIEGSELHWQIVADILEPLGRFPDMSFWANYLGWPEGEYGNYSPGSMATIDKDGNTPAGADAVLELAGGDETGEMGMALPLLALGAFFLLKK